MDPFSHFVNYPHEVILDDTVGNLFSTIDNLLSSYDFTPVNPIQQAATCPSPNNLPFLSDMMTVEDANFSADLLELEAEGLESKFDNSRRSAKVSEPIPKPKKDSNRLSENNCSGGRKLSAEEVMRVAAAHFIQLSSLVSGDPSKLGLPFGLSFSSLTRDEVKNVELASLLFSAAEKVNSQQNDRAKSLLRQCDMMSSETGNAVQRAVHYFSEALQERIDGLKKTSNMENLVKAILSDHSIHIVANNKLPFTQVLHSTAMQAILDSTASKKRIHMIDLSIKLGHQWTLLMQALATRHACPVELLKISAVGTSQESLMLVGNRLASFAKSLNLPFEFRTVILADMKDLREDMFELDEREALGIYSGLVMNILIVKPNSLDNLMRVILKLKPCIVTVVDIEAKHNSKYFINRFTEALFYFSAYFDCLDCLMERDDKNRTVLERDFFSMEIKSIIVAEGSERVIRQVGIKVWRSYFARFGLMETELSEWSMYQSSILIKQFVKDDSCTIEKNGNSLLIGWKGTPFHFVSAWKFSSGS